MERSLAVDLSRPKGGTLIGTGAVMSSVSLLLSNRLEGWRSSAWQVLAKQNARTGMESLAKCGATAITCSLKTGWIWSRNCSIVSLPSMLWRATELDSVCRGRPVFP